MTTKTIILTGGVKKEMTFEQILKQFKSMINREANFFISKFPREAGNREDIVQEMHLETWRAWEQYDEIHAFSTILTNKLRKVTGNMAQKINTQKRTSNGEKSMNALVSDNEEVKMEDMFAINDYTAESMIAGEMLEVILKELNEKEKQELHCILNPEMSVAKLAEIRGCSRQAANQKVGRTREKIQSILLRNQMAFA